MGSRQIARVKKAYLGEDRMTSAHRLALVWMAYHALDGKGRNPADEAGVYWGGHAELALEVYGATQKPATRVRHIRAIIRDLIDWKLIEVMEGGPDGYRVSYRLLPANPEGEAL